MKNIILIIFLSFIILVSNAEGTLIKSSAITTNMEKFKPINNLTEVDDDFHLVYFFVEFKRPIVEEDKITIQWLFKGQSMSNKEIISKSGIWWNTIYVSEHGVGEWIVIIRMGDAIILEKKFIYRDFISEDDLYTDLTFNELLNLKKNQRCAETLARLSGMPVQTEYTNFMLEGWRERCLFKNL